MQARQDLLTKASKTELDVERKRIDNLAKLPSGSTTGDAELTDIRIGFDGTEYLSAGTSVRNQSNIFKNIIKNSSKKNNKKIYNDIITTGKLGSMLNNTYGNFVIEKLITKLSKEEKDELIKEITKLGKQ